jgi:hypothetical protein
MDSQSANIQSSTHFIQSIKMGDMENNSSKI